MTEKQELGNWLVEHLMEWDKCDCLMWVEPQSGVHRDADWLTTTGDGMLEVLRKMHDRGFDCLVQTYYGTEEYRAEFYLESPQESFLASTLPLAVAHAAKTALEAKA